MSTSPRATTGAIANSSSALVNAGSNMVFETDALHHPKPACGGACFATCDDCSRGPESDAPCREAEAAGWAHLLADAKPGLSGFWKNVTVEDSYLRTIAASAVHNEELARVHNGDRSRLDSVFSSEDSLVSVQHGSLQEPSLHRNGSDFGVPISRSPESNLAASIAALNGTSFESSQGESFPPEDPSLAWFHSHEPTGIWWPAGELINASIEYPAGGGYPIVDRDDPDIDWEFTASVPNAVPCPPGTTAGFHGGAGWVCIRDASTGSVTQHPPPPPPPVLTDASCGAPCGCNVTVPAGRFEFCYSDGLHPTRIGDDFETDALQMQHVADYDSWRDSLGLKNVHRFAQFDRAGYRVRDQVVGTISLIDDPLGRRTAFNKVMKALGRPPGIYKAIVLAKEKCAKLADEQCRNWVKNALCPKCSMAIRDSEISISVVFPRNGCGMANVSVNVLANGKCAAK